MLENYLCVDDSCEEFCCVHVVFVHPKQRKHGNCKTLESPRNDIPFLVPRCNFRERYWRAVWRLPIPSCLLLAQPPHQFVIMSSVLSSAALDERKGKKKKIAAARVPSSHIQVYRVYTVLEYVIALSRECD